ncbi:MAG: septation protein SpoVG family protein [Planctomycetota bacterium]
MEITEVRIKLMDEPGERLKAFCSITFDDCFVVRDLKIIEGASGPFVAMPSRKLTSHCPRCGMKNHLRANHCNQCGARLEEGRMIKDADGRAKLYADIAHPINSSCREMIQDRVVSEYYEELELAKQPGYTSRYDDFDGGDYTNDTPNMNRFDSAHGRGGTGAPHHPPQGDPTSPGGSGPHTRPSRPTHTRTSSETNSRPPSEPGFGAGIFDS